MNRIGLEVTEFLVSMGVPRSEQHDDYRLEVAYRIGYTDALRNYAIWRDGQQEVGAMCRPLRDVLAQFQNTEIPERY